MLVATLTPGATTNNVPIPMTGSISTNNNLAIINNAIEALIPGLYEIVGTVTATSTAADDYGVAVYANGTIQGNEFVNLATGAAETTTLPVYAVIEVEPAVSGFASITIMPVGAPTIVSGNLSVKKIS